MTPSVPLPLLSRGQRGRIEQLLGRPEDVHRLEELGMRVGQPVEVLQGGPTCIVKLDDTRLALRDHEGLQVLVRLGDAD